MNAMFCTPISFVEKDKKCIKSGQKVQIQSFCKKGGVIENIKSLVPMDRVQMSLRLSKFQTVPVTSLINRATLWF